MIISEDTKKVVEYLDQYSENKLRKKNDLETIIEIAATYNGHEILSELIFNGKKVWNLFKKIKKVNPNDDGAELIQKELLKGIEEIRAILAEFAEFGEEQDKKRFDDIYLPDTRGTMLNVIDLSHDLHFLKNLQADSKKSPKND